MAEGLRKVGVLLEAKDFARLEKLREQFGNASKTSIITIALRDLFRSHFGDIDPLEYEED